MNSLFFPSLNRRHSAPVIRNANGRRGPPPPSLLKQECETKEVADDELGSSDHDANGETRRRRRHSFSLPTTACPYDSTAGFGRCQVSPGSHKVTISMGVPPDANADNFRINVRDGVLQVEQQEDRNSSNDDNDDEYNDQQQHELDDRPPTNMKSPPTSPRRRSFSLDEQVLDISHAKARLSQKGILDIIVPKLSDKQVTKKERIPISTDPPPEAAMSNNSNNLTILMDPPGTNAENLYIHYSHGRLEISGECGRGKLGNFKRTVPIDVKVWDPDEMKAFFYKDVLVVLVPARADHDQRDIDVRSYSTQSSFVRLSSHCSSEGEEDFELSGAVRPVQEENPLLATWG